MIAPICESLFFRQIQEDGEQSFGIDTTTPHTTNMSGLVVKAQSHSALQLNHGQNPSKSGLP